MSLTIGVLALQGGFEAHRIALERVGASVREVRLAAELGGLGGLVLPGGESTSNLRLLSPGLESAIRALAEDGAALLGTCAGAILLSDRLGLLDVEVRRNAHGSQLQSFVGPVEVPCLGAPPMRGSFIRAPAFDVCGPTVEVLGTLRGEPVFVRQGAVAACTFHPELGEDPRLHAWFADLARKESSP